MIENYKLTTQDIDGILNLIPEYPYTDYREQKEWRDYLLMLVGEIRYISYVMFPWQTEERKRIIYEAINRYTSQHPHQ